MMSRYKLDLQARWCLLLPAIAIVITAAMSATSASAETTQMPAWLEPRGLSVIELVGLLPEASLQGTIISYGDGSGIVVYESGSRNGNTLVVTARIYPRFYRRSWAKNNALTIFGCLGQVPYFDHMGSVVPASTLRVYNSSGREVTSEITSMSITRMETRQPLANTTQYVRYPRVEYGPQKPNELPIGPQGLNIPANSGCQILLPGANYYPLTGVFTLTLEPSIHATVLETQQATFQTYIGVGNLGIFQPLMNQMRSNYPDRDTRIPLSVPAQANYFLVKFPPMAGDAYADSGEGSYLNADRLSGGTYRLAKNIVDLSTNLIFSAGFPARVAWQDAGQVPGSVFLPVMRGPSQLAAPEYVLPANIAYNSCFTQGNCGPSVLQQIYDAQMTLEIMYLGVTKPVRGGQWVPLKMAGPSWSPSTRDRALIAPEPAAQPVKDAGTAPGATRLPADPHTTFFPLVVKSKQRTFLPLIVISALEEEPTGCPCGWFDNSGRMLGFWP
jgi:hypothetical protein